MRYKLITAGFALLWALIVIGVSGQQTNPIGIRDVPERYWFLYEPNWPHSEQATTAAREGLPFEAITLERMHGMGMRNYSVTLRRDGTALFDGTRLLAPVGICKGTVDLNDFGRLCLLIERFNLEKLPEDAREQDVGHGMDGGAVTIHVTRTGGTVYAEKRDIESCGPIELWAIQMAIDAVAQSIEWKSE